MKWGRSLSYCTCENMLVVHVGLRHDVGVFLSVPNIGAANQERTSSASARLPDQASSANHQVPATAEGKLCLYWL